MTSRITTQTLLDQYRDELAPEAAQRERMLGRLSERVAREGAPLEAPSSALPAANGQAARLNLIRVGPAVISIGALLLGAAWWWFGQPAQAPRPNRGDSEVTTPVTGVPATTPPKVAPPAAIGSTEPRTRTAEPPARATLARQRVARASKVRAPEVSTATTPAAPAEPRADAPVRDTDGREGIEAELRLIRSAHDALHRGQPEVALARLADHAARFPHGELTAPRRVARIMALCQAGRVQLAREEAQTFLQSSPNSPHAARVRTLCVETRN